MTYAIPIIALLLIICAWLYRIAIDAEAQAECWQREAQEWEETADNARAFAQDAIDSLAVRQNELDVRDAQIEQLRQVRHQYLTHLASGCPARSVHELRRETWDN